MAAAAIYQEELYHIPQPVVVIIDKPWKEVSEPERQLLSKILGAIEIRPGHRLSLLAVQIVTQSTLAVNQLTGHPTHIIAFSPVPPGVPLFEVIKTPDYQLVASEPLHQLILNDDGKKRLWGALRAQFGMGGKPA